MTRFTWPAAALVVSVLACACSRGTDTFDDAAQLTGGDPRRGMAAIGKYGCGGCHTIPGIQGASATIGPPLAGIARRAYLAGQVPNTPADMMKWIQHPQHIEKGTAMPEMGVTEQDSRDITAYLYTLR